MKILTLKMTWNLFSRCQFDSVSNVAPYLRNQIRLDISYESSAGRQMNRLPAYNSYEISNLIFLKNRKNYKILSAAVMIGALKFTLQICHVFGIILVWLPLCMGVLFGVISL